MSFSIIPPLHLHRRTVSTHHFFPSQRYRKVSSTLSKGNSTPRYKSRQFFEYRCCGQIFLSTATPQLLDSRTFPILHSTVSQRTRKVSSTFSEGSPTQTTHAPAQSHGVQHHFITNFGSTTNKFHSHQRETSPQFPPYPIHDLRPHRPGPTYLRSRTFLHLHHSPFSCASSAS